MDAAPLPGSPHPPKQAANDKVRKLAIHVTVPALTTILVEMRPVKEGQAEPEAVRTLEPLEKW